VGFGRGALEDLDAAAAPVGHEVADDLGDLTVLVPVADEEERV
jgi:hypothetical protein